MADANVAQVFQNLALEMPNVSTALGTQGIHQIVTPFEGEPKKYKEWVKSIEKYAVLTNLNNDKIKRVVYQASRGSVSEFIRRYQDANQQATWDQLKGELSTRFSDRRAECGHAASKSQTEAWRDRTGICRTVAHFIRSCISRAAGSCYSETTNRYIC